jgi:pyruvate,water dikinase
MFAVGDISLEDAGDSSRELETPVPLNLRVLDLGGGLASRMANSRRVKPEEIVSRPFRSFWKGMTHPGVSWQREMPASFGDLASVLAESFKPQHYPVRALGEKSYLLVADEYMNLNARLAYHFSLVDACLSDVPGKNYIALRFEGGGSARERRHLRACFIEECLAANGFSADRRGDLVNAWLKKAPADQTGHGLDILGRLLACSSQLDMYMESASVMKWFVRQFLAGNYSFQMQENNEPPAVRVENPLS